MKNLSHKRIVRLGAALIITNPHSWYPNLVTETKSRAAELAQFFKFYIAGSEKAYISICTCDVLYLHETVTVGLHSLRPPAVTRYLFPSPCSNSPFCVGSKRYGYRNGYISMDLREYG